MHKANRWSLVLLSLWSWLPAQFVMGQQCEDPSQILLFMERTCESPGFREQVVAFPRCDGAIAGGTLDCSRASEDAINNCCTTTLCCSNLELLTLLKPFQSENVDSSECSINRCPKDKGVELHNVDWQPDAARRLCTKPSECTRCPNGSFATGNSWDPCVPCGSSALQFPGEKLLLGSTYCPDGELKRRSEGMCTYRSDATPNVIGSTRDLPIRKFGFDVKVTEIDVRDAQARCGSVVLTSRSNKVSVGRFSTSAFGFRVENTGDLPVVLSNWNFSAWVRPAGALKTNSEIILNGGQSRVLYVVIQGAIVPVNLNNNAAQSTIQFVSRQLFSNPGVPQAATSTQTHEFETTVLFDSLRILPEAVTLSGTSDDEPIPLSVGVVVSENEKLFEATFTIRDPITFERVRNLGWIGSEVEIRNTALDTSCGSEEAPNRSNYEDFVVKPFGLRPGTYQALIVAEGVEFGFSEVQFAPCLVILEVKDGGFASFENTVWQGFPFQTQDLEQTPEVRKLVDTETSDFITENVEKTTNQKHETRILETPHDTEFTFNNVILHFQPRDQHGFPTTQPAKPNTPRSELVFYVDWERIAALPGDTGTDGVFEAATGIIVKPSPSSEWSVKLDVSYTGIYRVTIRIKDESGILRNINKSPVDITVFPQQCAGNNEVVNPSTGDCTCDAGYGIDGTTAFDVSEVSCEPCAAGTASPLGQIVCLPCDNGYVQPLEAQGECTRCPPGSEASSTTTCQKCGENEISGEKSDFKCSPCSPREIAVGNRCYCRPGFYLNPRVTDDSKCVLCPEGGYCAFADVTSIQPLPGYWKLDWVDAVFIKCENPFACKGVPDSAELVAQLNEKALELQNISTSIVTESRRLSEEYELNLDAPLLSMLQSLNVSTNCADGYQGPFCAECVNGYFPSGDGHCAPCDAPARTFAFVGVTFLLFLVLLVGMVLHSLNSHKPSRTDAAVTILKITASHLQVLGFAQSLHTDWPNWITDMFGTFSSATSAGALDIHCIAFHANGKDVEYIDSFIQASVVFMLAPVIVGLFSIVLWAILHSPLVKACVGRCKRNSKEDEQATSDEYTHQLHVAEKKVMHNGVVVSAMVTVTVFLFLTHPFLIKLGLSFFACTSQYFERSFLREALSVECGSERHNKMLVDGYAILLLYGVGVPLLVLGALFGILKRWPWPITWNVDHEQDRKRLQASDVMAFNFLHRSFVPKYFYWESVIMLRKASFAVIAVVPSNLNVQVLSGTAVSAIAIMLQVVIRPFKRTSILAPSTRSLTNDQQISKPWYRRTVDTWISVVVDLNHLELFSLMIIVGTLWSAKLTSTPEVSPRFHIFFSVLLVLSNAFFFGLVIFTLGREAVGLKCGKSKSDKTQPRDGDHPVEQITETENGLQGEQVRHAAEEEILEGEAIWYPPTASAVVQNGKDDLPVAERDEDYQNYNATALQQI